MEQQNDNLIYMDTDSHIAIIKQMIFMQILPIMLKNGLTRRLMIKGEAKDHYLLKKAKL